MPNNWQDNELRRLQLRATRSFKARGHYSKYPWERISVCHASRKCDRCQAEIFVDINPPPNGIDISGEGVALNCPVKRDGTD